jgi:O-antigen/teichoic acid export membrane protein
LLARNTLFNLLGQGLPLLVALVTIPYVVRGLGPERFGLLSLAWVILGYFTVFDLGLGRATTKYVAELIGRGEEERVPEVVWTAVACQLAFGLVGGAVLFVASPLLVERVLRVPPSLAAEARRTFEALSLGVPIVLVASSLSGALEARQRFDLVNAVRIPASAGTYLLPVVGVALGTDLAGIVLLIVLWRAAAVGLLLLANSRPPLTLRAAPPSTSLLPHLLRFGGWIMVSSLVAPVLAYLDRFLVAALVSVAAVGHYVASYEAITRLAILPASLAMVLFPAFSRFGPNREPEVLGALLLRSIRLVAGALAPLVLMIAVFAGELMQLWLGPQYAAYGAPVLRVLAAGVFLNSLAHPAGALIQAMGRPDLTAKFHVFEVPVYVGIATVLVAQFGAVGAAWAWTLRVFLDTGLFLVAAIRLSRPRGLLLTIRRVVLTAVALMATGAVAEMSRKLLPRSASEVLVLLLGVSLLVVGGLMVWRLLLDDQDRLLLRVVK